MRAKSSSAMREMEARVKSKSGHSKARQKAQKERRRKDKEEESGMKNHQNDLSCLPPEKEKQANQTTHVSRTPVSLVPWKMSQGRQREEGSTSSPSPFSSGEMPLKDQA